MRAPGGPSTPKGSSEHARPARPGRATLLVAASAACALWLTGCSAGGSGTAPAAAKTADAAVGAAALASSSAKPTAPVAPVAPAKPAASALPPGSSAAGGDCATADLNVTAADRHEQEGVDIARFVVTNAGAGPCQLKGTSEITPQGPLGDAGAGLEANLAVSQDPFPSSLDIGSRAVDAITLQPGKSASFFIGWFPASPVVCEESDSFGFDAPNDPDPTDATPVTYAFGPMCNGLFYVSAVEAS